MWIIPDLDYFFCNIIVFGIMSDKIHFKAANYLLKTYYLKKQCLPSNKNWNVRCINTLK